ncbi:MAG: ribonuclease E inhibitor RraB, partial [Bacilli bacterium]|nr:ribonuclease E inhibitor RraB [Bacilli bacterium]
NNIINNKIPETVNLFEEQSIILVLAFENKENALNCFKELKESGEYEQIDYDDNSKHVKENNLNKLYTNMIYIEQRTRIGLSKLNMITDYMYDIAKKYNGSFEEWGIGELTKEED